MRWIITVILGIHIATGDIPTYFLHERCGQSVNLRRESVYMVKIEVQAGPVAYGRVENHTGPCIFSIESWTFQNRLMINFEEIAAISEIGCTKPVLEVFDGPNEESPRIPGLVELACNPSSEDHFSRSLATTDTHLTFRYHGNSSSDIRTTIVAFHEGRCRSYEYQCLNGRCIMSDLVCNGYNPCGDYSDCPTSLPSEEVTIGNNDHVTIVVIVSTSAVLVITAVLAVTLIKCYTLRRKQRRFHRHQDYTVVNERPLVAQRQDNLTESQPVYERTVSQIEAEIRYAPPSYSQLPVLDAGCESSESESDCSPNIVRNEECLNMDANKPPSYTCVVLHQDEFNVSESNIHDLVVRFSASKDTKDHKDSSGEQT